MAEADIDDAPIASKSGFRKQNTLVNTNRQRQIITRLQALQIASTFPFLSLPAELRLEIYGYSLNFNGLDKWFEKFYQNLLASRNPEREKPPVVYRSTPAILLLNKQIHHEAIQVLKTQGISFHHGLLDIVGLENLMNVNILKSLTSITIDASGHDVIPAKKSLIGPSWRGHLDMIVDLSNLFKGEKHNLKKFTLNVVDKTIHDHVANCWAKDKHIRCDYRDQLKEALMHLDKIRSVGTVNLIGIPDPLAKYLKSRMESPPLTFTNLPGEIRNQIYEMCGDWSDISKHLTTSLHGWFGGDEPKPQTTHPPYHPRTTPTILLLNKQIYREAKSVLHAKPLLLHMPIDARLARTTETLNAQQLISAPTLANVQHLDILIESWEWVYALDRMVANLAAAHRLRRFAFTFRDDLKRTFLGQGKPYPDHTLHQSLSALAKIRGVECVELTGDLPASYTAPLKTIMESSWVAGEQLPALRAVKEGDDGVVRVVDIDDE